MTEFAVVKIYTLVKAAKYFPLPDQVRTAFSIVTLNPAEVCENLSISFNSTEHRDETPK